MTTLRSLASRPRQLLVLISLLLTFRATTAQRQNIGCYDGGPPIVCQEAPTPEKELDFLVEDACLEFALKWLPLPNDQVLFDTSLHMDYLNQIDSEDEFCSQIREAYSHCVWCHQEDWIDNGRCFAFSYQTICGGQPTLEEVLANTEDYAEFETQQDIEATCVALEKAYLDENLYYEDTDRPSMPASVGLCQRQEKVKHLCPGFCEGGCFSEEHPPSCDPNAFQGEFNATADQDWFRECQRLETRAFYRQDFDVILNTSMHLEYMRVVPDDPFWQCNVFRQVYSRCIWCADSYCFNEEHPASCEVPPETTQQLTTPQIEGSCEFIYFAMTGFDVDGMDLFNASLHTGNILIPDNNTVCDEARQAYPHCFWCAPDADLDFCMGNVCGANHSVPDNFQSETLAGLGLLNHSNPEEFCEHIRANKPEVYSNGFGQQLCYDDVFIAQLCPVEFCKAEEAIDINDSYLGADTLSKKRALIWLSRTAAFLSFCGATYILYDILTDRKNRTMVYHQLLVGMAIFDIITAVAWAFGPAPIDKEEGFYVEGAIGNKASCTAQAFFVQLGLTSVFYNVSLASYYVLVVAYGWRDFQLEKVRIYMHAVPLTIGFGLAFGGIPIYGFFEYGCHLRPPPHGDLWPVLVFFAIPLGFSILAITASMLVVYCTVRKQAAASRQWSMGVGQASRMETRVFYQCLFYVLAFYVTWPIMFCVYLAGVDDARANYGLSATIAFVAPLQGFNNFLVYVRPKLKGWRQQPSQPNRTTATTRNYQTSVKSMKAPSSKLLKANSDQNIVVDPNEHEQVQPPKVEMEPIEEIDVSESTRPGMSESIYSRPSEAARKSDPLLEEAKELQSSMDESKQSSVDESKRSKFFDEPSSIDASREEQSKQPTLSTVYEPKQSGQSMDRSNITSSTEQSNNSLPPLEESKQPITPIEESTTSQPFLTEPQRPPSATDNPTQSRQSMDESKLSRTPLHVDEAADSERRASSNM